MDQLLNLKSLLVRRLVLLYNAESQARNWLGQLSTKVYSLHLQRLLADHLERIPLHLESVGIVLEQLGELPQGENAAVATLIKELDSMLTKHSGTEVGDAAIIGSVQNILHYFISGYGTCCAYAGSLGMTEEEKLFNTIVEEEKQQDKRLSRLAKENIYEKAKFPMMV